MEARYAIRKRQLLDECQVSPEIFEHVIPRLYSFMKPFVTIFQGQVGDQHAKTYVCGLLSNLERKNVESIAYRFDHSRLPLQAFIGWEEWDDEPLRLTLRHQVEAHLGQGDGVLVFDPSGFPQSGCKSVGVADSGVGVWAKSTTAKWPCIWATSPERATPWWTGQFCRKNGPQTKPAWTKPVFPKAYRAYRTRHQLALELFAKNGAGLPHGWISGDDEMGQPCSTQRSTCHLGERYLLAVPSNTAMRDLETEGPEYRGQGRRPRAPWQSVEAWSQSLGEEAWHRIDVRDGSKSTLVVEAVKRRMLSRTHRRRPAMRRCWWSSATVTATSKRW